MAAINFTVQHIATGETITFSSFALVEYQDNISTKYNPTEVFGKMDPIITYQGSVRKISVGVRVQQVDKDIQQQISKLMAFQYPTYANKNNALTISRPPLVKVTLGALLTNVVGAMDGFAFTPQVGFTAAESPIVRYGEGQELDFTSVTMKFNLTVLHNNPVGWNDEKPKTGENIQRWLGGHDFGPGKLWGE